MSAQLFIGAEAGAYNPLDYSTIKVGLVSDYQLLPSMSIHSELVYIEKLVNLPLDVVFPEEDFRNHEINYFKIPITFQLKLNIHRVSAKLMLGPYWAYGLGISAIEKDSGERQSFDFSAISVNRMDFGAVIGGGFEILIAKGRKMFVDFRYNVGLMDIDHINSVNSYNEGSAITMGILLPLRTNMKKKEE
ncbi:MAG: porin family protein [Bacteroidota bacterium]